MEIRLNQQASDDLNHWKKTGNEQVLKRIRRLLESISVSPFAGIGKPEPLRFELPGKWSRRINKEHRMVYKVERDVIQVYSLRGHY